MEKLTLQKIVDGLGDLSTEEVAQLAQAVRATLAQRIGADELLGRALGAVPGSFGLVSIIAERLKVSRAHLYNMMKDPAWGVFRWACEAERDAIRDAAEATVFKSAISGNLQSAQFLLLNIGRDRGYGPQADTPKEALVVVDKRRRPKEPAPEAKEAAAPEKAAKRAAR